MQVIRKNMDNLEVSINMHYVRKKWRVKVDTPSSIIREQVDEKKKK